jgi:hypothetical protein
VPDIEQIAAVAQIADLINWIFFRTRDTAN